MTTTPDPSPEREGLRECPFCGGPASVKNEIDYRSGQPTGRVWVQCDPCDCFPDSAWSKPRAEAIAAWNTRASTHPGRPMREEVDRASRAIIAAQTMRGGYYTGWNITALNKAVEELRAALGMEPTPLSPETLRMMEHAKRNRDAIRPLGGEMSGEG